MNTKLCCIIFLLVIPAVSLYAQESTLTTGSPEWLVEMFFIKDNFENKAGYFTGEMLDEANSRTIGEELQGSGKITYRKIFSNNNQSVFAAEITEDKNNLDFYCYIINTKTGWKIEAIRSFTLPAFIYSVKDSLSELSKLSADDEDLVISLKMITMSDKELNTFVQLNINELQNIIGFYEEKNDNEIDNALSQINCNAVFSDDKYPGCTFISISAFSGMELGIFYIKDKTTPIPEISPYQFVYVEEVLNGWYVYRIM